MPIRRSCRAVCPGEPELAKEPRAAACYPFPQKGEPTNAPEVLFFTMLVNQRAIDTKSVQSITAWASEIVKLAAGGSLPDMPELKMNRSKPGAKIKPVYDAYGWSWPAAVLEKIAGAMQTWRGPGRVDGVTVGHVKRLVRETRSPPASKQPAGPPRAISSALVGIASMIKEHGVALRKLLVSDEPVGPTVEEQLQEAEARAVALAAEVKAAEAEVAAAKKATATARDTQKHQAARLKKRSKAVTEARRDERAKAKAKFDERLAAAKPRIAAVRAEMAAKALREAEAKIQADCDKREKEVSVARKRARTVEAKAKAYAKCLRRAQTAEAERDNARAQLDEMMEADVGDDETDADDEERPESPTLKAERRDERGRFAALPDWIRVLVWSQLARRVPPSAINADITDVLRAMGEDVPPLPSERELKRMRNEVTVAGECLAAFQVALAQRIVSFGFDESTKFGLGLLASNTQIETQEGEIVDVVLRGATLTAGGTSERVAKSVDAKIFSHSRRLLAGWKAEHEKLFKPGSWAADGGPDPTQIGIHRLAEETVIMGDNCNGERKSKRLVATAAMAAKRLEIGNDAWEAMSEEEREAACMSFIGDCHDHLRNTIVQGMTNAATGFLKDSLEDSLSEFSSYDRMSVDCNDLIYSCWKELHPGGAYEKGKGREGQAWRKQVHPKALYIPVYNAHGGRQDKAFDGSHSLFANWDINTEFLNGLVNVPRADNKLELFLWRLHHSNEMRAYARVNTLWKLNITDAMRWLSGKAEELQNWSLVSADRVLELAEAYFEEVAADGSKLLDPTLDPFAEIAASQPAFAKWREERAEQTMTSPDGTTTHKVYADTLAEAQSATTVGNVQATPTTIKLAEVMATGALTIMHDTKRAIAEKLTSQDGACAPAKRQKMHKATIGAHVNNSRVESIFGSYDYVGHIFRGASAAILGGLAQCMRNRPFERAPNVASDRRKRRQGEGEAADGIFHRLRKDPLQQSRLQQSLVSYVRKEAVAARKLERDDLAAHDAAQLERREERVISLLKKAVEDYAYSKELFRAWNGYLDKDGKPMPSQAAKSMAEVDRSLKVPEAQQLEYLRKQIELRTIGLGWSQYATRWSSNKDAKIGTVAHLRALLMEILTEETTQRRLKQLPTEAALPQQIKRNHGQLGTADAGAKEICKKQLFSTEELDRQSDAEMQRRIAAGIADTVENMNGPSGEAGAPNFDQQLVGKQTEVCWRYTNKDTGEPMLIWAPGRIKRVADGLTDKRSPRARAVLPAGMVLWAWDADPEFGEAAGEQWLALLPQKWNPPRQLLYGWRYDPREFAAAPTERDERRRGATRAAE